MQRKKDEILKELRAKGLLREDDSLTLSEKLLMDEIEKGRKKDSVIERIMDEMKNKGLILLPNLLIFLHIA